jgi:hypothetical protein
MKPHSLIRCVPIAVVILGAVLNCGAAPPTTAPAKIRVGVYDSRAVCIASRGSPAFAASIQELQTQLKQAEAAKDTKRAEQIKQRGKTLQTLRHLQAFSNAPVDDLLVHIQDKLPEIARTSNVSLIAARADFHGDEVEIVDVTDALVDAFGPDARTLKVIADLRNKAPIPLIDALEIKD